MSRYTPPAAMHKENQKLRAYIEYLLELEKKNSKIFAGILKENLELKDFHLLLLQDFDDLLKDHKELVEYLTQLEEPKI